MLGNGVTPQDGHRPGETSAAWGPQRPHWTGPSPALGAPGQVPGQTSPQHCGSAGPPATLSGQTRLAVPPAAGTQRLPGGKPAASGPVVPSGDGAGASLHPQHAPLPQAPMKPGPWAAGARAPLSLLPALPERRAGWRASTVPRQGATCLLAGPDSRLPLIPPEPPQVSENHTASRIREFNTFHLNPTPSHDPQNVSTLPPGRDASTRRRDSLWDRWPPLPARALGVSSKCSAVCLGGPKLGSHHSLQVQDPQGLGDLGAGVHLAVHAH